MSITWLRGTDTEGHWTCALGEVHVPSIRWRPGDSPDRYEYLAEQARAQAESEREQIARLERMSQIHQLQAEAYTSIASELKAGR